MKKMEKISRGFTQMNTDKRIIGLVFWLPDIGQLVLVFESLPAPRGLCLSVCSVGFIFKLEEIK